MRFRRQSAGKAEKLQFTALIDMVFLLLVFFMLTLKITAQEGELNIEAPAVADDEGRLESLRLGTQSLGGGEAAIEELRREMTALVARRGTDRDPIDVEIDSDYQLDYRHVIGAISAVTGRTETSNAAAIWASVQAGAPGA